MIDRALAILASECQNYLNTILNFPNQPLSVLPTAIVDDQGKVIIDQGKIGLSLINIEEERIGNDLQPRIQQNNGVVSYSNPDIRLILHVLFTPNMKDYQTKLTYLSHIISFFQTKSVFDDANTPSLNQIDDPTLHKGKLEKLIVNLQTLSLEQQNYVWASIGTRYLPSAIFRVRLLLMRGDQTLKESPAVQAIGASGTHIHE